jgi:hypothetical protein
MPLDVKVKNLMLMILSVVNMILPLAALVEKDYQLINTVHLNRRHRAVKVNNYLCLVKFKAMAQVDSDVNNNKMG